MHRPIWQPNVRVLVVLSALGTLGARAAGQCEVVEFRGDTPAEEFGITVAISGARLLIARPGLPPRGAVDVVERLDGQWRQVDQIAREEGELIDSFGLSLGLYGNRAIISAELDSTQGSGAGAAYVFEYVDGTWVQVAKLVADDGIEGAFFGSAVAISGDYVVVGAPNDDEAGFRSGSAYVFERQTDGTWLQAAKLVGHDTEPGDHFGNAVAICAGVIVVGAWNDDDLGWNSGSAYVFERSADGTWSETAKLLADDGGTLDNYGYAVGVDAATALVGAVAADGLSSRDGAVYVYEANGHGGWGQVAKLFARDGSDGFGWSVDADGSVTLIGAPGNHEHGTSSGAAYVFVSDADGTWSELAKLVPDDGQAWDEFGRAVAVSGNIGVIGTFPHDYNNDPIPGKAYLYAVGPDDDGDGVMDACECPGDLNQDWIVDHDDLAVLLNDWGCRGDGPDDCPGDADADGDTDQADLGLLLAYWGEICP